MKKAMTPHSSTLDWEIPRTEESGRLQSMGSQRVRHGNIRVHVTFSIVVFLGYVSSSRTAGSYGGFIPSGLPRYSSASKESACNAGVSE